MNLERHRHNHVAQAVLQGLIRIDRGILNCALIIVAALMTYPALAAKNQKPIANAGIGQTVTLSTLVSLDGGLSYDPEGSALTYRWTQTKGPKVRLKNASTPTPTFLSPVTLKKRKPVMLRFKLTVTDKRSASASAVVSVTLANCLPPKTLQDGNCIARYAAQSLDSKQHNCALLSDGSVKCWGFNERGQLGLGDSKNRGSKPEDMGDNLPRVDMGDNLPDFVPIGIRTAKALAVNAYHTCAILDDNRTKCWGRNDAGLLGIGDQKDRGDDPNEMGGLLPHVDFGEDHFATSLALGLFHSCAVLDNRKVKCWGLSYVGRLGIEETVARGDEANEMGDHLPFVDLGSGRTVQALAAGNSHTCALLDDNTVKCWGANVAGCLGTGDTANRGSHAEEMGDNLLPVNLGSGRTAKAIAVGGYSSCAILDNGRVKCWGYNDIGQLGLGDTRNRGTNAGEMGDKLPYVNLGKGRTAKQISVGGYETCVILDNDQLKCWGTGSLTGLGDSMNRGGSPDTMGNQLPAVNLGTGRTAKAISTGIGHSCALLDDATIKCFGSSWAAYGALGLGDAETRGDQPNEMGDYLPIVDLGH